MTDYAPASRTLASETVATRERIRQKLLRLEYSDLQLLEEFIEQLLPTYEYIAYTMTLGKGADDAPSS